MMKQEEKTQYVPPQAEIVEFESEEHIASSANYGSDTICGESLFD
ncbi:MAG: hypothetical protein ACLFUQ_07390 [Candidatus Izemoplasmataceae bacterium]